MSNDNVGSDAWLWAWGLGSVAAGAASLLIPLYVVGLGGGPGALGVLAASAAVAGVPGALIVGRLADRSDARRRILLLSLATVGLSVGVVPLLSSIPAIVLANAVLWFVWAAATPVVTMLAVGEVPETAWPDRIGRLNEIQGYGWAGGLVLGTVWTVVGGQLVAPALAQQSLFVICGVAAVLAAGLAGRWLPAGAARTLTPAQGRRVARVVVRTRRNVRSATFPFVSSRLYWTTRTFHPRRLSRRLDAALGRYLLAAGLFFTGAAAFWAPLPAYLATRGFADGPVFALYLASSVASAALYGPAGRAAARFDLAHLQGGALGTRGVMLPVVALAGGLALSAPIPLLAVGAVLAGIGATWGIIAVVGTAIVTRLAADGDRGSVLGVYTALGAVGGALGGLLGGSIATVDYLLAFGVGGALVLVGAAMVLLTPSEG